MKPLFTGGVWLHPDGKKEPPIKGVTESDLSFRMMFCWLEWGEWEGGDKTEREDFHASLHCPQLVSPSPLTSLATPRTPWLELGWIWELSEL